MFSSSGMLIRMIQLSSLVKSCLGIIICELTIASPSVSVRGMFVAYFTILAALVGS